MSKNISDIERKLIEIELECEEFKVRRKASGVTNRVRDQKSILGPPVRQVSH